MKKSFLYYLLIFTLLVGCADNSFEELPLDNNFPLRLVLDAEEGADLPTVEDYRIEFKLADYLPSLDLPNSPVQLTYQLSELEDDMVGAVMIDKVVYEVELDDCVFERELEFTTSADGLTGTILLAPDADLGSIPTEWEVILTLPGTEEARGSFVFELTSLESTNNLLLGAPVAFEYSVLENEVAGEWNLEITSDDEFESFKEVFGILNADIQDLSFSNITGNIKAEFGFEEMKFEIELVETEEVTTCENGETETEVVNKIIEFEAEYDAEEGEFAFEGSREIINANGLVEGELDFILEGVYELNDTQESVTLVFVKLIDEDNYKDGEELFLNEDGILFTFIKD